MALSSSKNQAELHPSWYPRQQPPSSIMLMIKHHVYVMGTITEGKSFLNGLFHVKMVFKEERFGGNWAAMYAVLREMSMLCINKLMRTACLGICILSMDKIHLLFVTIASDINEQEHILTMKQRPFKICQEEIGFGY